MQKYLDVILTAVKLFPLVALLITLPSIIVQYHRYGALLLLRMAVVYSFVLYLMCVVLLTMLPIPSSATDALAHHTAPQFIPLQSFQSWFSSTRFRLLDPSTWGDTVFSRPAFFIFANVLMMIPLGIYLRYYFACNFARTLVLAFGLSLILELIQLTGLFGVYSVSYRTFDVDDLITNTLGGAIGYGLAGPLMKLLPTRQQLNDIAYRKGQHVSFLRRLTAAAIDWLLIGGILALLLYAAAPLGQAFAALRIAWRLTAAGMVYVAAVLVYFVLGEWLWKGQTLGKRITHLRCADSRGGARQPKLWQYFVKYAFLYLGYVSIPLVAALLLAVIVRKYLLESRLFTAGFLAMALYGLAVTVILLHVLIRHRQLPHTALSNLTVVNTLKS